MKIWIKDYIIHSSIRWVEMAWLCFCYIHFSLSDYWFKATNILVIDVSNTDSLITGCKLLAYISSQKTLKKYCEKPENGD